MALRTKADDIKRVEMEKTLGRLANLSASERELVEAMASSIVNKLIHNTMVTLKAEVNSSDGASFVEAARRFFSLGDPALSLVDENAASASETGSSSHEESKDVEAMIPRAGSKRPDH